MSNVNILYCEERYTTFVYETIKLYKKRNIHAFVSNEIDYEKFQIHFGIISKFKKESLYMKFFFQRCITFIGITSNILHDCNIDNSKQSKYVMISLYSWNHRYKTYIDTIKDRYKIFESHFGYKLKINKINKNLKNIVIFVQNYSKYEYWFGWREDDIIDWLKHEEHIIRTIKNNTKKHVVIKFHPKTCIEYVKIFITYMNKIFENLEYIHKVALNKLCVNMYCCVVNSGTTCIYMCLQGKPIFYVNDDFSNIPMKYCCSSNVENIDDICNIDLPSQKDALDFIGSQILDINEYTKMIYKISIK
jgi:hypothetical protein